MGYEPTFDAPVSLFPAEDAPVLPRIGLQRPTSTAQAANRQTLVRRKAIRFGGLSLDRLTGVVYWRTKPLALGEDEREMLVVLMEHAGRILSLSQIALLLDERLDATERRLQALHLSLRALGVRCLPRRAEGLGYILWY